jgi:hypothetical protein
VLFELRDDGGRANVAVELLLAIRVQADDVPPGRIEREGWGPPPFWSPIRSPSNKRECSFIIQFRFS